MTNSRHQCQARDLTNVTPLAEPEHELRYRSPKSFSFRATDDMARIIQHEADHLDGILIIDRCSKAERKEALQLLRQLES